MSEFGPSFDRAQRNYDAQMPEEYWDCKEQGHRWQPILGEAKDGTRFVKCTHCGLKVES